MLSIQITRLPVVVTSYQQDCPSYVRIKILLVLYTRDVDVLVAVLTSYCNRLSIVDGANNGNGSLHVVYQIVVVESQYFERPVRIQTNSGMHGDYLTN